MGSLNSIKVRSDLRSGMTSRIVADEPIAFKIRYKGNYSVTSVTVTTAVGIILIPSTGDTVTITFAAYTTMGAVAEAINGFEDWDCQLLDVLRADASVSVLIDGVITASNGTYDATLDTSAALNISYRCAYDRSSNSDVPAGAHRVHLKGFTYYADLTPAANKVQVWEYDKVTQTETQVYQALSVDTTPTEIQFASGEGWITSGWGNELIVRITTADALSDTSLGLEVSYDRE